LGAISYAQSFAPLLNQGAKDKPCGAKMKTIFAPQLLRAEYLINDEKSGLMPILIGGFASGLLAHPVTIVKVLQNMAIAIFFTLLLAS